MKLVKKRISELKKAPYNPRRISKEALAGLQKSIEKFGLVEPIIINKRTGHVVGGHQRFQVLKSTGAIETDVIEVDLSESEEKALNITLNNPHITGEFTEDLSSLLDTLQSDIGQAFEELRLDKLMINSDYLNDLQLPSGNIEEKPDMKKITIFIGNEEYKSFVIKIKELVAQYKCCEIILK